MATAAAPSGQTFTTRKIHPTFGLEISGFNASQPLDPETLATLTRLSSEHKLLLFKDQTLSAAQIKAFAAHFGDTNQIPPVTPSKSKREDDVTELGTKGTAGGPILGYNVVARFWHSDSSWRAIPSWLTFLTAVVLPDADGDTAFADMEAAYATLPEATKARLAGKHMIHSFTTLSHYEQSIPWLSAEVAPPPATHPLVCTVDGRKCLFLNGHAAYYVGNMPFEEGRALFDELMAHATSEQFVYQHKWTPGDLAMWDNRTTMHRAMPYDLSQPRLMNRAEVKGTQVPTA